MSAFRRFDPWLDLVEEPEDAAKAAKPAKDAASTADVPDRNTAERPPPAPKFSNFSGFSRPAPAKLEKWPAGAVEPATPDQAEDYRERNEERAAIAEHDGGLDRAAAERIAFEDGIAEWLNRNPPVQADPYRCLRCGEPEGVGGALLPVLTGDGGHVWIHDLCYPDWLRWRRAAAAEALARMRIGKP